MRQQLVLWLLALLQYRGAQLEHNSPIPYQRVDQHHGAIEADFEICSDCGLLDPIISIDWRHAMYTTLKFLAAAAGTCAVLAVAIAFAAGAEAKAVTDKYTLKVPGGLAFSEFRGYEDWAVIAISENGGRIAAILGNPKMVNAYKSGIPGNGKPFPDGSRLAKIHWNPKQVQAEPGQPTVPGNLDNVDFMVKDSKRFADSGGWGWASFNVDPTSGALAPATLSSKPPQANDAKCGFACHSIAKTKDFVFTDYGKR
jgi:hypothetical protein